MSDLVIPSEVEGSRSAALKGDGILRLRFAPLRMTARSLRVEQNPSAIFAAYNFFSRFHACRSRSRHFHVAAGANAMLDGNDSRIALAFEKTFEPAEQILVNFRGQMRALCH